MAGEKRSTRASKESKASEESTDVAVEETPTEPTPDVETPAVPITGAGAPAGSGRQEGDPPVDQSRDLRVIREASGGDDTAFLMPLAADQKVKLDKTEGGYEVRIVATNPVAASARGNAMAVGRVYPHGTLPEEDLPTATPEEEIEGEEEVS
jgi:hypothetical protein